MTPKPYFIDRWSIEGERCKRSRFEYDTESEALHTFETLADMSGSSRIVLRKRGFKQGLSSAVKVWERPL